MLELPDNDFKVAFVTAFYETKAITLETTEKIKILSQKIRLFFKKWKFNMKNTIPKILIITSGFDNKMELRKGKFSESYKHEYKECSKQR